MRAAMAVLIATLLCLLPGAALAQERSSAVAELGLDVVIGFGGKTSGADWTPVEIYLEPAHPVAGTLEVRSADGLTQARDIEVAAASRAVYRFLVPHGRLEVTVDASDRDPVAVRKDPPRGGGEYLGGVLGQVPAGVPSLGSEATGQVGAWVGVDPAWLELSAQSIDGLGGLVAGLSALEALPEEARRNLAAAVAAGLDLTIVADRDGPIDLRAAGLPTSPAVSAVTVADGGNAALRALEPSPKAWAVPLSAVTGEDANPAGDEVVAAAVPFGAGRVAVVGAAPGEAGAGRAPLLWGQLVQPASASRALQTEWEPTNPWQFSRIVQRPGATVPSVPWLAAFILSYVAVVGPVNGVVLSRMGRRELAWVTVPVVTVVFTVGAFAGAVGRSPAGGVVGRLAYFLDGQGTEIVAIGMRAPTEGAQTAVLPGGDWSVRTVADGGQESRLTRGEDTTVRSELSALQLGGVLGWQSLETAPPLSVEAVATGEAVAVTITNTSERAVSGLQVRLATAQRTVGGLGAGQSETVELRADRLRPLADYADPMSGVAGPDGLVALPDSLQALVRGTLLDGSPGLVWVLGTTEEAATGVRIDGRVPDDGGTLVAVGARVTVADGAPVPPQAVARTLLIQGNEGYMVGPLTIEGPSSAVLRYRFPPGADTGVLFADFPALGPSIDLAVWDHGSRSWQPTDDAFGDGGADAQRFRSPLGEVFVRATGELFPFNFSAHTVSGVDLRGGA